MTRISQMGRWETGDQRLETGDQRPETGDGRAVGLSQRHSGERGGQYDQRLTTDDKQSLYFGVSVEGVCSLDCAA